MSLKKIQRHYIRSKLPIRKKRSNKTDGGQVLICGGGKGFFGAPIMTALAATKSGAGYTHLMSDITRYPWLKFPDFIVHPLKVSELKNKKNYVIAIGPGLGLGLSRKKMLEFLLRNQFEKVLLDADALTLLSQMKVTKLPHTWILTPHEGELARLLKTNSKTIASNRVKALKEAQKKFGCIILLKGADTIITDSSQEIYQVSVGNSSLAKAGTGDTLLGIIAALYSQNLSPLEASILGSYIHGYCSKLWIEGQKDHLSLRPLDIIDLIPEALKKLRK